MLCSRARTTASFSGAGAPGVRNKLVQGQELSPGPQQRHVCQDQLQGSAPPLGGGSSWPFPWEGVRGFLGRSGPGGIQEGGTWGRGRGVPKAVVTLVPGGVQHKWGPPPTLQLSSVGLPLLQAQEGAQGPGETVQLAPA